MNSPNSAIFVVDDEVLVTTFTKAALQRSGHSVVVFNDAATCLEALSKSPQSCRLLITDHFMPRMTGARLAEAAQLVRGDLPVVMISGDLERLPRHDISRLRQVVLLAKPFTVAEITSIVDLALSGARQT